MFVMTDSCFPVTHAERRRAPRRRPAREVIARLLSPAGEVIGTALVWNVSRTGVSMLTNRPLESGTQVEVELVAAGAGSSSRLGMRVAHRSPLQTGDHVIGGPFDRPLDDEELRRFTY